MFHKSFTKWALSFAALSFSLVGCTGVHFSNQAENNSKATICTGTDVAAISRLTKIIFVVDTSGSNVSPTMNNGLSYCDPSVSVCTPATDPTKSFRGGAIQSFFNHYQQKANFDWGFVTFSGTQAQALTQNGYYAGITSVPSQFQQALQTFYSIQDGDATPYKAALQLTTALIQNDLDLNATTQPQYFVIFLTDGFPTDYQDSFGNFKSAAMQSDLAGLLAVAPGRVSLSSVYYGQADDQNAMSLLKSMALQGGGRFAHAADTTTVLKIDDVIPGKQACP